MDQYSAEVVFGRRHTPRNTPLPQLIKEKELKRKATRTNKLAADVS